MNAADVVEYEQHLQSNIEPERAGAQEQNRQTHHCEENIGGATKGGERTKTSHNTSVLECDDGAQYGGPLCVESNEKKERHENSHYSRELHHPTFWSTDDGKSSRSYLGAVTIEVLCDENKIDRRSHAQNGRYEKAIIEQMGEWVEHVVSVR